MRAIFLGIPTSALQEARMQQRNCRDPGWLVRAALCVLATTTAHADGRDRVRTVGSSTVFPFASAVAEAFGRTGRWKTPII